MLDLVDIVSDFASCPDFSFKIFVEYWDVLLITMWYSGPTIFLML